ncbi:hypothetical protein PDN43_25860 [Bacillus cereus]|nr:hypothetical protein [Bacillus cereus]MDA2308271.1 hypothetical protein [Bacillus cereus]
METSYVRGMNLGVGFNSATRELHPVPALTNVTRIRDVPNAGGQEVLFRLELAKETISFAKQLNVSSKDSLKIGSLGGGSTKAKFFSSFKEDSYTVYIFVYVLVNNSQTLLDMTENPLIDGAANLFVNSPEEFINQYGDTFVYGINTGGEYIGILEISSSTKEEFQMIQGTVSGHVNWEGATAEGLKSLETVIKELNTKFNITATVMRQGTSGEPISIEPEELIHDAVNFPNAVTGNNGYPYSVILVPYNNIPHPPAPPLNIEQQSETLEKLGNWREQFLKFQNNLSYVINNQQQFPDSAQNLETIKERYNKISDEISKIVSQANSCFLAYTSCSLPHINLDLLDEKILPMRIENIPSLGTTWYDEGAGWTGTWKRRGWSNIFDATWVKLGEPNVTAVLTIKRIDNKFVIHRRNSSDGNDCDLTGTLASDGRTVTGEYQCIRGRGTWNATIIQ